MQYDDKAVSDRAYCDSIITEAALVISLHGFGEHSGSVEEPDGLNFLVHVSRGTLLSLGETSMDLGETALARALDSDTDVPEAGALVWIRAYADGHVRLVMSAPDGATDEVSREWLKFVDRG